MGLQVGISCGSFPLLHHIRDNVGIGRWAVSLQKVPGSVLVLQYTCGPPSSYGFLHGVLEGGRWVAAKHKNVADVGGCAAFITDGPPDASGA